MNFFVNKLHQILSEVTKVLRFDRQTCKKCCSIILYRPDGRIVKLLSFHFLQYLMQFIHEQIHDYNPDF